MSHKVGEIYVRSVDLGLNTLGFISAIDGVRNLYNGITTGNENSYQWAVIELGFSAWRVGNYLIDRKMSNDLKDITKKLETINKRYSEKSESRF